MPHRFIIIIAGCFALHFVSIACAAAGVIARFGYTERLSWKRLYLAIVDGGIHSVARSVQAMDVMLFISLTVGLLIVLWTRHHERSKWRIYFFILQPLIFHTGFIGIILWIAFPLKFLTLDGEWLAEDSPRLMSFACWILSASFIAIRSSPLWRERKWSGNVVEIC